MRLLRDAMKALACKGLLGGKGYIGALSFFSCEKEADATFS